MEEMKACNSDDAKPKGYSRGQFLTLAILGAGAVAGAVLGGSALGAFLSPAWKKKEQVWLPVVDVDKLPEGEPTLVSYTQRRADGWIVEEGRSSVWLVKSKGAVTAFDPHCTHLGCPFRWDPGKNAFLCPCHSGQFNKDGVVIGGPPPRPLDRFGVRIEQGIVSILPSRQNA